MRTSISSVTIGSPCRAAASFSSFKPVDARALERVRARARLERAAAHQPRAASRHGRGRGAHLRRGLDRARAGDHLHGVAADRDAAHAHDRARLVPFARDELVGLHDVQRALHAGQRLEHRRRELALVADRADQRALGAARNVDAEALRDGSATRRRRPRASPASGCITTIMALLLRAVDDMQKNSGGLWGRPNRGFLVCCCWNVYGRACPSGSVAQK